jgi:hypothetical protein
LEGLLPPHERGTEDIMSELSVDHAAHTAPSENAPDESVLDALVGFCNDRVHGSARDAWVAIAERVVDTLWDGDVDAALEKSADAHATWRALLGHPKLRIDRSMLSRCRGLLALRRELPSSTFEGLRIKHLFVLLAVPDAEARWALAHRAFREGWSVERLRVEAGPYTGYKPTPAGLLAARRALGAIERMDAATLTALPADQARTELEALEEAVAALRRRLKAALAALPSA